jgi:hypothetical protein
MPATAARMTKAKRPVPDEIEERVTRSIEAINSSPLSILGEENEVYRALYHAEHLSHGIGFIRACRYCGISTKIFGKKHPRQFAVDAWYERAQASGRDFIPVDEPL